MALKQIIYSSQPFGFDDGILNSILSDARANNSRDGITGALICRQDVYLQMLEGPEEKLTSLLERLKQDDRHVDMKIHVEAPANDRMFGQWAMLHDPERPWLWTHDEVANGALDRATQDEIKSAFSNFAAERAA